MTDPMRALLLLPAVGLALLAAVPAGARTCDDPFDCPAAKAHSRYPLTVLAAKTETRRRAAIMASGWSYPGYVMTSFASRCTRKAPRALDCKFSIYQIDGPPRGERQSCHYVSHVYKPRNLRRVQSAVETMGCEFH